MDKLYTDILIQIAVELDYSSILTLCSTNKTINKKLCLNNIFWMNKLNYDYPQTVGKFLKNTDYKKIYLSLLNNEIYIYEYLLYDDNKSVNFLEYVKKHKNMKDLKVKIIKIGRFDKNTIYEKGRNFFIVKGDFPPGTDIWLNNGKGFLTKDEAMEEFEKHNYIKKYIENSQEDINQESNEQIYQDKKKNLSDSGFLLFYETGCCIDSYYLVHVKI